MTASIGIWAQGDRNGDLVLYRWEADQRSGFVSFEVATRRFQPVGEDGRPLGDRLFDAVTNTETGTAETADWRLFAQVVASLLRGFAREGAAPATAHAYYY